MSGVFAKLMTWLTTSTLGKYILNWTLMQILGPVKDFFKNTYRKISDKIESYLAKKKFIDSVPINPVPDAYTICKFATLTLFVVRHGITPKEKLLIIDEDPKMQDLKNVHIVFNGIR